MTALCCVPFLLCATIMTAKFAVGLAETTNVASKDANLLAGDSMLNYRIVASLDSDTIIDDYAKLLARPRDVALKSHRC